LSVADATAGSSLPAYDGTTGSSRGPLGCRHFRMTPKQVGLPPLPPPPTVLCLRSGSCLPAGLALPPNLPMPLTDGPACVPVPACPAGPAAGQAPGTQPRSLGSGHRPRAVTVQDWAQVAGPRWARGHCAGLFSRKTGCRFLLAGRNLMGRGCPPPLRVCPASSHPRPKVPLRQPFPLLQAPCPPAPTVSTLWVQALFSFCSSTLRDAPSRWLSLQQVGCCLLVVVGNWWWLLAVSIGDGGGGAVIVAG
jgi:hypothetical protein